MGELLPLLIFALVIFYLFNRTDDAAKKAVEDKQSKESEFRESIKAFIETHKRQLAIQRSQLIRFDPYGKEIKDLWIKEMDYFIEHHIFPKFKGSLLYELDEYELNKLRNVINSIAKGEESKLLSDSQANGFDENMSGVEFEVFCKTLMERLGWEVTTTKKTGDQGVDLLAQKDNTRIAVQCKKYSGPVGNQAVQEVVAGMQYYKTDHGIVISNSSYTASAKQLAKANKILLLHYNELDLI